ASPAALLACRLGRVGASGVWGDLALHLRLAVERPFLPATRPLPLSSGPLPRRLGPRLDRGNRACSACARDGDDRSPRVPGNRRPPWGMVGVGEPRRVWPALPDRRPAVPRARLRTDPRRAPPLGLAGSPRPGD